TEPFPEAHFATFPTALVEPMILAGASPKACPHCGAPWERVVEIEGESAHAKMKRLGYSPKHGQGGEMVRQSLDYAGSHGTNLRHRQTTGWRPTCSCSDND